jgi:ubiquinone/menaquinone biosynthesis C-methylase UbiE
MGPSGDDPDDVPSPIDLRDAADARAWVASADSKRPWRAQLREAFADLLHAGPLAPKRVLELGAGPGLLAEAVLRRCPLESYTLFDFSIPMLELSRERLASFPAANFVHGDFKAPGWLETLTGPFDAVLAMQAVHEIRHKRHVPTLYQQVRSLLRPGGSLLVCDHTPPSDSPRMTALHSTVIEQHEALRAAGFVNVRTAVELRGLYLCAGEDPA